MSETIAAVVFDLDGVLLDSESDWDAAWRDVVAHNGGRWQADATRAMMGMWSPGWSSYLHDQLGVPLEPKQINDLVVAALLDQYRRHLPLFAGGDRGGQTARGPLATWAGVLSEPPCDRRRARASGNHRLLRRYRLG